MTQTLFVTRGHTVVVGDVAHGPGAAVTLAPAEAQRLAVLGFLADAPPEPDPVGNGLQDVA